MIEYVSSWFTPTVLFCVLNLVIGTILLSSTLKPQKKQQHQLGDDNSVPQLAPVPSLFQRVRSFNYSLQQEHHTPSLYRAPSLLQRLGAVNFSFSRSDDFPASTHHADPPEDDTQTTRAPSLLERVRSINLSFSRSRQPDPSPSTTHLAESPEAQTQKVEVERDSETVMSHDRRTKSATCAEIPAKKKKKMEKSASEKMEAEETEEEVDRRRPATVREKKTTFEEEEDDEAVDEKADDFINRFKQQLKLQRLDSLLRYKETLHRRMGN
ncbi:PREDICTED: DNA ligase 1-like [Ipomoea nil]|uniref:DNA ligase 1-like n=1 Tax=Ipomoea nil TaxID=35883 RepID=UPI000901D615|nr:PREDICTED: DNA ligase 1-like [Ipomoea nil]